MVQIKEKRVSSLGGIDIFLNNKILMWVVCGNSPACNKNLASSA